jgi:hypothetical protein
MQITSDQLALLIKLQPFFKEKMGEWQQGDLYYNTYCNNGGFIQDRDIAKRFTYVGNVNDLRIPQPLDPECSERCLWKMIKEEIILYEVKGNKEFCCSSGSIQVYADNPYTALLKALVEQEGL